MEFLIQPLEMGWDLAESSANNSYCPVNSAEQCGCVINEVPNCGRINNAACGSSA
jgi:hypothetical protein